jgi:hypothetical protein
VTNVVFEILVFAQNSFADNVVKVNTGAGNSFSLGSVSQPGDFQSFLVILVIQIWLSIN